jgi:hypothetical protein
LRSGERRPASVGDKLFVKDVIETGSEGTIGITFIDNTVFSTGPDSQIALDAFEFDSTNFRASMLADMRRGTLAARRCRWAARQRSAIGLSATVSIPTRSLSRAAASST